MTSTQIRCFLAAAEAESFSAAAQTLFMAQPTFGRNISALEQELGILLFSRSSHGVTLTASGAVLRDSLTRLIQEFHKSVLTAQRLSQEPEKRLKVGLLAGQLLDAQTVSFLHAFQNQHPEIQVDLCRYSFAGMLEDIKDGRLDIGITLLLDVQQHTEFNYLSLYTLKNELVFPKNHPLAGKAQLSLGDFSEDTFIEIGQQESEFISPLLRQTCRNAGFEPKILTVKDLPAQILAVESGHGIAAFNEYHQACNHPNLAHIPLPDFPAVEFCAVWLRETVQNPATMRFVDMLRTLIMKKETVG